MAHDKIDVMARLAMSDATDRAERNIVADIEVTGDPQARAEELRVHGMELTVNAANILHGLVSANDLDDVIAKADWVTHVFGDVLYYGYGRSYQGWDFD